MTLICTDLFIMNNRGLAKPEFVLLFIGVCHGALGVYSLVEIFVAWGNGCWQGMSFVFLVTSLSVLFNIFLIFKMKRANLYDEKIRLGYKRCLIAVSVPMLVNMFLSVVWWGQSDLNPVYCSLVTQMGLS